MRDELGVPVGTAPFAMVALGHPAVRKELGARYEPGCVHRERW